jgi:hypothetical protein
MSIASLLPLPVILNLNPQIQLSYLKSVVQDYVSSESSHEKEYESYTLYRFLLVRAFMEYGNQLEAEEQLSNIERIARIRKNTLILGECERIKRFAPVQGKKPSSINKEE